MTALKTQPRTAPACLLTDAEASKPYGETLPAARAR
jgi:hypothetical protein